MTASDKKKTGLLVLLLIVAGVTWYFFVYRPTLIPAGDETAKAAAKQKAIKQIGDAQLHLELANSSADSDVGQKNLFQYRQKPAPPRAITPNNVFVPPPSPPPNPQTAINIVPTAPPYKAFKYEGFAVIGGKNGKMQAALSEGGNPYIAKEGDCLMGQYCITRITENLVEIQDIVLKRSQTVPRTQQ